MPDRATSSFLQYNEGNVRELLSHASRETGPRRHLKCGRSLIQLLTSGSVTLFYAVPVVPFAPA